jgi:hypothetical protein
VTTCTVWQDNSQSAEVAAVLNVHGVRQATRQCAAVLMMFQTLTMPCYLQCIVQDFVTGPPDAGTVVTRGTFGVENVTGPGHVSSCVYVTYTCVT